MRSSRSARADHRRSGPVAGRARYPCPPASGSAHRPAGPDPGSSACRPGPQPGRRGSAPGSAQRRTGHPAPLQHVGCPQLVFGRVEAVQQAVARLLLVLEAMFSLTIASSMVASRSSGMANRGRKSPAEPGLRQTGLAGRKARPQQDQQDKQVFPGRILIHYSASEGVIVVVGVRLRRT